MGYEKEKITLPRWLSVLLSIWFIGTIAVCAICGLADNNAGLFLIMFGQVFIVISTIFIYSDEKRCLKSKCKKNKGIRVLLMVGILLVTLGVIVKWHLFDFKDADAMSMILKIVTFMVAVLFSGLAIHSGIGLVIDKALCTEAYDAECVQVLLKRVSNGNDKATSKLYCPVYRIYTSIGVQDLCNELYASFMVPKVGEKCTIYLNRDHNGGFLDKRKIFSDIQNIIVGIAFAAAALYTMVN